MWCFMTMTTAASSQPPLEDWIRGIADGDSAAFTQFYNETHRALYAFALTMVRNPHEAEDVLQDGYMAIVKHAASYRAQGKPLAWAYRIVRNGAIDRLRDRANAAPDDAMDALASISTWEIDRAEDRVVLETCMRCLSKEEHEIVVLHAVAGLRHREIAALLSLPLSTVLSKYRRALHKLKRELEGSDLS